MVDDTCGDLVKKAFEDTFDLTSTWFNEGYQDGLRDGEQKAINEAWAEGEKEGRKVGGVLGRMAFHLKGLQSPKAKRLLEEITKYVPTVYNVENSGSEHRIKLLQTQYKEVCTQLSVKKLDSNINEEMNKLEF